MYAFPKYSKRCNFFHAGWPLNVFARSYKLIYCVCVCECLEHMSSNEFNWKDINKCLIKHSIMTNKNANKKKENSQIEIQMQCGKISISCDRWQIVVSCTIATKKLNAYYFFWVFPQSLFFVIFLTYKPHN